MNKQSDQKTRSNLSGQDHRVSEKDGKEMLLVPAGGFIYGEEQKTIYLHEFWIDKTPVTNREFARFVEATGYKTTAEQTGIGCANITGEWNDTEGADWQHPGGPGTDIQDKGNHPAVQVSWGDAMAYAKWAGKRLPTEKEWEKAARGMDGREYPWGNQRPTRELCNFNKHEGRTTSVGKYSPQGDSPYGCVDMSGNIWEWTVSDDGSGGKVLRGGGWSHPADFVRLALRSMHHPDDRYDTDGFRCVLDANEKQVTLRSINRDNWREVARLEVEESQREFVAELSYYLALCSYGELWQPLAVYLDEQIIGFLMWAVDTDDGSCWLGGILIDKKYQRKGYGRQAIQMAIKMLLEGHGYQNFALSYSPDNPAKHLYHELGFIETDEWEDDEVVARLSFAK